MILIEAGVTSQIFGLIGVSTAGAVVAIGISERAPEVSTTTVTTTATNTTTAPPTTVTATSTATQTVEAIGTITYGAVAVIASIAAAILATRRRSS